MEKTTFRVLENGPLEIKGKFEIRGTDGSVIETGDSAYMCRCGGSGNKPFCDGTHRKNGFSG